MKSQMFWPTISLKIHLQKIILKMLNGTKLKQNILPQISIQITWKITIHHLKWENWCTLNTLLNIYNQIWDGVTSQLSGGKPPLYLCQNQANIPPIRTIIVQ